MAQTYTRQSTFADGDTITAALFNDEYNQLVNAFAYSSTDATSTGHRHDGTAGQGGNIPKIGDLDFLNKIEVDSTNNRWGFYVEVSSAAVEQIRIQDGAIVPVTDNDIDLGTSSLEFKDLYLDGTATIDTLTVDGAATVGTTLGVTGATTLSSTLGVTGATTLSSTLGVTGATTLSSTLAVTGTSTLTGNVTTTNDLSVGGNLTVTGNATISGNLTFGDADTDSITLTADVASHITPDTDNTYDLGSSTKEWRDLYIDGTAYVDAINFNGTAITATAAELNIMDGVTATATEINLLDGVTSTTAELNILDGVTSTTAELNILDGVTATAAELNVLDGVTAFVDEDDMSSNSATSIPSQQSVKAYVDSQVTAQDLDFQGDSGGALSIDLDSETLTIAGGTGIDTTGATNTLTVAIDSTVATLTGTQTLTNKTLTSPDVNTPDIDGGTIDNTVIGGTTAAAGTFTTFTSTGIDDNATSTAITIDASENVGIGTTSPGYLVDARTASGNAQIHLRSGGDLAQLLLISNDTTGTSQINFGDADANNVGLISYSHNQNALKFTSNSAERMRIDSSGNVGIGTTSPGRTLDVEGIIRSNGTSSAFALGGNSSTPTEGAAIHRPANGTIAFVNESSESMRIDSSGRVGIGVSSPAEMLDINEGSTATYIRLRNATSTTGYIGYGTSASATDMTFWTGGTKQATIDGSGRLLINTSSSRETSGGERQLQIEGTNGVTSSASITRNQNGTAGPNLTLGKTRAGSVGGNTVVVNGDDLGSILFSGADGTDLNTIGASILSQVDGTPSSNVMPANLIFSTNQGGSGVTEAMRISSNGQLKIGGTTNSPANVPAVLFGTGNASLLYDTGHTGLHINNENATAGIDNYGAGISFGRFASNSDDQSAAIVPVQTTADQDHMGIAFLTHNTNTRANPVVEKMRLDADGNLGLGTDDPSRLLHLHATDSCLLQLQVGNTTGNCQVLFGDSGSTTVGKILYNHSGNSMSFETNSSEQMRIDSAGNLLVGTTSASGFLNSTSETGVINYQSGALGVSKSSDAAGYFKRLGNDGVIVDFRNSTAASVGSIGSNSSNLQINGTGAIELQENGTTRAYVESTGFHPWANNTYDLGLSSARWQDLYLAGGAYLGGTAAANHLDDYEEGTWTPSLSYGSATVNGARYVKIGRLVYAEVLLTSFTDRSTAASVQVGGLPFTSSSDCRAGNISLSRFINRSSGAVVSYLGSSRTYMHFYAVVANADYQQVYYSHLSASNSNIYISITYEAS